MKTHFYNPEYLKKVAVLQQQALHVNPPAILFRHEPKPTDKEENVETKKLSGPSGRSGLRLLGGRMSRF